MTNSRAIWAAYSQTGADRVDCPNCGAEKDVFCTRPDGRVRKTPCVSRIDVSHAVVPAGRDFSEPTHQSGALK